MECSYLQSLDMAAIPSQPPQDLLAHILECLPQRWRVAAFFGLPENPDDPETPVSLICVLAHLSTGMIKVLRSIPLRRYPSFTPDCPQVHLFERELYECWGVVPEGHPLLEPVRFSAPRTPDAVRPLPAVRDMFQISGEGIHEVAVGPVHAGIIEPGHFRFQCYGENVLHLDISLGFQHRGIETMLRNGPHATTPWLVECMAGDTSIGHASAYSALLEKLCGIHIPERAQALRRIMLELERLACHTGDLGALAGDAGFLPTAAWCGRIRGDFLNMTAMLCGNRFGRGSIRPGGTVFDTDKARSDSLAAKLRAAFRDMQGAVDLMLEHPGVLARFSGIGAVSAAQARSIGMVGVAAKASGLLRDARFQFPLSGTPETRASLRSETSGDVLARALIRRREADDAVRIIEDDLAYLATAGNGEHVCRVPLPPTLPPQRLAVSFVEGWRGTICHTAITDDRGRFRVYKVVDPSFHNWYGLSLALRGQQISDFPLCNKSFNLSYCGHDL